MLPKRSSSRAPLRPRAGAHLESRITAASGRAEMFRWKPCRRKVRRSARPPYPPRRCAIPTRTTQAVHHEVASGLYRRTFGADHNAGNRLHREDTRGTGQEATVVSSRPRIESALPASSAFDQRRGGDYGSRFVDIIGRRCKRRKGARVNHNGPVCAHMWRSIRLPGSSALKGRDERAEGLRAEGLELSAGRFSGVSGVQAAEPRTPVASPPGHTSSTHSGLEQIPANPRPRHATTKAHEIRLSQPPHADIFRSSSPSRLTLQIRSHRVESPSLPRTARAARASSPRPVPEQRVDEADHPLVETTMAVRPQRGGIRQRRGGGEPRTSRQLPESPGSASSASAARRAMAGGSAACLE